MYKKANWKEKVASFFCSTIDDRVVADMLEITLSSLYKVKMLGLYSGYSDRAITSFVAVRILVGVTHDELMETLTIALKKKNLNPNTYKVVHRLTGEVGYIIYGDLRAEFVAQRRDFWNPKKEK